MPSVFWKLGFVALLLCAPSLAYAQASITGVVKDASGGVLPGVTVEVSSPVLIERVRTAVTDGTGQYRITDLRPGTYAVTFSLGGFATIRRAGIELSGTFIASVNAELRVGELTETVTVSGETPIVDLQGATQQRVMSQEVVEKIPTSRYFASLAVLIPGVTVSGVGAGSVTQDVGGTTGDAEAYLISHGSVQNDQRPQMNGTDMGMLNLPHNLDASPAMSSVQEVVIDTGGVDASAGTGGVRVNFVPKDGGNSFAGTIYLGGANGSLQSNNLTQALKDRGLAAANPLKRTFTFNPGVGGPIEKDKLWFYFSYQYETAQGYLGGLFQNKNHADPSQWTYVPNPSQQIYNSNYGESGSLRLTWQATSHHKFAVAHEQKSRCFCPDQSPTTAREASSNTVITPDSLTTIEWSAPLTSRLLLQAAALYSPNRYGFQPTVDYAGLIPATEQSPTSAVTAIRGRSNFSWVQNPVTRIRFSAAYVTGAHAFKAGATDEWGTKYNPIWADWPYSYTLNRGIPVSLTENAYPIGAIDRMQANVGIYGQDQWTLGRLTLNGGVRIDLYKSYAPPQEIGPATLTPDRHYTFPKTPLRDYKDLSPKLSGAYDLFGNGKTAVKVSLNRYVGSLGCCGSGNPVSEMINTANRAWTDGNHNYVPDCDLTNASLQDHLAAGGDLCGALTGTGVNFGKRAPGMVIDPLITKGWGARSFNWEFSTGVQRQLMPRVGVDVRYFRRWYGNQLVTDNRAVTAGDFGTFSVSAPQDSQLPNGGGYVLSGLKNINPDKASIPTDNFQTFAKNYGGVSDFTNSIDANTTIRGQHILIQGGLSSMRQSTDNCALLAQVPESNPLTIPYCHAPGLFVTQYKGLGSYTVPRIDVILSAAFQNSPGPALSANYVASNQSVQPSLGRPLSGNAANVAVNLLAPRSFYGDRMTQLDLRFGKLLHLGPTSRSRIMLNVDVYNIFNAASVLTESSSYSSFRTPTSVLTPRLLRLGAQLDF